MPPFLYFYLKRLLQWFSFNLILDLMCPHMELLWKMLWIYTLPLSQISFKWRHAPRQRHCFFSPHESQWKSLLTPLARLLCSPVSSSAHLTAHRERLSHFYQIVLGYTPCFTSFHSKLLPWWFIVKSGVENNCRDLFFAMNNRLHIH